jgi:hypothetical protein
MENRFNGNDIIDSHNLPCPEGAAAQSPGLPLRLPWELEKKSFQPQGGCASAARLQRFKAVATALRL